MAIDITAIRHPRFTAQFTDWHKWRLTYDGGTQYRTRYLKKFSKREDKDDFQARCDLTPVPNFAKAAVNDIRNSIFQRMTDIIRRGGSKQYHKAIAGEDGGVDRRGNTMNSFVGNKLLTEMLVMGAVGVYVDNDNRAGGSLANGPASPYLYSYPVEDILSWRCSKPEAPGEFESILLRETCVNYDLDSKLPTGDFERYRHVFIGEDDGLVHVRFFNEENQQINNLNLPTSDDTVLNLTKIPFVLFDIGDSLIRDVCEYQIALLNLVSSDVWYALKSNFPFYVEQRDNRQGGAHLKPAANADGTATTGGQGASEEDIDVGPVHGRSYGVNLDAPSFIHPSPEPLMASMKLQDRMEAAVRKMVNLAVQTLASRESAESKEMDNQGLEAGLSFIGLQLEKGERLIADAWAAYENVEIKKRQIPTIQYPDRYSLKDDSDRIKEAEELQSVTNAIPSKRARKELSKLVALKLFHGKVSTDRMTEIEEEIEQADFTTGDPDVILKANEQGLAGDQTSSKALGFADDEYLKARDDHAERIKRIQDAQTPPDEGIDNPAARGVDDLSPDPSQEGREERRLQRQPDLREDGRDPVRGEAD